MLNERCVGIITRNSKHTGPISSSPSIPVATNVVEVSLYKLESRRAAFKQTQNIDS